MFQKINHLEIINTNKTCVVYPFQFVDWHGTQKEKYTAVVDTRDMGLAHMTPDVLFDVLLGCKQKSKPLQIKFITFQS